MDTKQLLAFERIAREGSFSRAAQEMDLSQPTLSARIRALEGEVGGALFVRGGRGVLLSALGESFLPYARRALGVLDEGREAARLTEAGQRGRVTVGVIESLTGGFFAAAVRRFHREHPQAELFVRAHHSDGIVQLLEDGVVKLGLMAWPFFAADLVPLLRFQEPLRLVVAAGHPLAGRGSLPLAALAREAQPLLLVRWGPLVHPLLARLEALAPVRVEVPIDTARQMVLHGVGAAFLTETLVAEDLAVGRLVALPIADLPLPSRESALVQLHRTTLPAAAQGFLDILRGEAGSDNLIA